MHDCCEQIWSLTGVHTFPSQTEGARQFLDEHVAGGGVHTFAKHRLGYTQFSVPEYERMSLQMYEGVQTL